ncbi:glutamate formimidoyltransferase [Thermoactinomyces mirandus]|uniref:glutamate formimidoyltransferase n=1 Tax=Thermoactinomyces mirandus TaxID=2756294 RepID=A0A7W2AR03_9BACL|nr:glutamate formimidoyltransferase [Thermoactinomyces mirandus]MBA4602479.1 glutamate formimidoyltransferase [Thermoactinomyces mirandus]
MESKLVEFVPNFSEGRDQEVIQKLVDTAKNIPGIKLLDAEWDRDHNRSVFTMVGSPEGAEEAAVQLCRCAMENIDMTKHQGSHPRMGATDVMPFVPVKNMTIDECVELSKRVARRIWDELKIPSFLYGDSATSPKRRNLAKVRKGQFEGMPEKLLQDEWAPDYGGRKIHPTAGIVAIGARKPLVAFNVILGTDNLEIANKIARIVRASNGGFRSCKGIGVKMEERGVVQVSMNMVDYEDTPLYRAFETIRFEAKRYGVPIVGSEIIGLTPAKALIDAAEYYLRIENFDYSKQVLENHLI